MYVDINCVSKSKFKLPGIYEYSKFCYLNHNRKKETKYYLVNMLIDWIQEYYSKFNHTKSFIHGHFMC